MDNLQRNVKFEISFKVKGSMFDFDTQVKNDMEKLGFKVSVPVDFTKDTFLAWYPDDLIDNNKTHE